MVRCDADSVGLEGLPNLRELRSRENNRASRNA